jgi:hypothetical protein
MKAHYEGVGLYGIVSATAQVVERRIAPSEHLVVRGTATDDRGRRGTFNFPVRPTPAGYKIDWEAAVGHNPTALRTFIIQRPKGATRFRLQCELATHYHGEFFDCKDTHYSVLLKQEDPIELAHGFIAKNSAEGRKLFELLKDGRRHEVTLEFQNVGPYGQPLDRPTFKVVSITRVVSASWVDR